MKRRVGGEITLIFCHVAFACAVCCVDSTMLPPDMLISLNFRVRQEVKKVGGVGMKCKEFRGAVVA